MSDEVRSVRPGDREVADPTQGKVREQAIAVPGLWSGFVRTEPGSGDFVRIPPGLVHREVNAGSTRSQEVITRSGTGPLTVNVDGPEALAP